MLATIFAVWTVAVAQQGNQSIPGAVGGGVAPSTPGIPSVNGYVYYAINYGVKADTLSLHGTCGITATLSILTCTNATFTSADVGKIIFGNNTPNNTPDIAQTTIASVQSATQLTITGTALRTMTNGDVTYGHDDTAALKTGWAAMMAAPMCGTFYLPAGEMIIQSGVMNMPASPACESGQIASMPGIKGSSFGQSVLVPTPTFAYGSAANCTLGTPNSNGCVGVQGTNITDLEISSGLNNGLTANNTYNGCWLFSSSPAVGQNIYLYSYSVPGNMQSLCVGNGAYRLDTYYNTSFSGNSCGAAGTLLFSGAADVILSNLFLNGVCSNDGASLQSTGTNLNIYSVYSGSPSQHSLLFSGGGSTTITSDFASNGLKATGAGTTVNISNSYNVENIAALTTKLEADLGATVTVSNSIFKNTAAGANVVVKVDSTSTFIDGCGNTFSANNGTATVTAGGLFIPCPNTLYQGSPSTPTITGTGACATVSTQKGTIYAGQVTCTGVTGASTLTITPGTTAPNGFRCSANDTTTLADTLTTGPVSATNCAFTGATIAANDVISFSLNPF